MRATAIAVMVALAATGCSARSALIGTTVGTAMVAGGIACGGCAQHTTAEGAPSGQLVAAAGVGVIGLSVIALVVHGVAAHAAERPARAEQDRIRAGVERMERAKREAVDAWSRRAQARKLFEIAQRDAAQGHCHRVHHARSRALQLDAELAISFVEDRDIARCLAPGHPVDTGPVGRELIQAW